MSGGNTAPFTSHRCLSLLSYILPLPIFLLLTLLEFLLIPLLVVLDVIDYYHLADDKEGNPVFSLDVRPAVDDLESVGLRVGEWWKMKKESLFGDGGANGGTPGVRVQE